MPIITTLLDRPYLDYTKEVIDNLTYFGSLNKGNSENLISFVKDTFKKDRGYHNHLHCLSVANRAMNFFIADNSQYTSKDVYRILLAGLFHDAGYLNQKDDSINVSNSRNIFWEWANTNMDTYNISKEDILVISKIIESTKSGFYDENGVRKLISDTESGISNLDENNILPLFLSVMDADLTQNIEEDRFSYLEGLHDEGNCPNPSYMFPELEILHTRSARYLMREYLQKADLIKNIHDDSRKYVSERMLELTKEY